MSVVSEPQLELRLAGGGTQVAREQSGFSVRPLGGGFGCLVMILVSVAASVVLTVVANLVIR